MELVKASYRAGPDSRGEQTLLLEEAAMSMYRQEELLAIIFTDNVA